MTHHHVQGIRCVRGQKKKNQKKVITLSPCWNCPPANLDSTRPWFGSCVGDRRRPRRMAGVYHYVATPKMRRESRRRAVGRGGREDFQGCVGQGQFFFFFFFFSGSGLFILCKLLSFKHVLHGRNEKAWPFFGANSSRRMFGPGKSGKQTE